MDLTILRVASMLLLTCAASDSMSQTWASFKKDSCVGVGVRQYSAQLMNIPWGVDWIEACWHQQASINGHSFPHPARCKEDAGVWGEFDVPDTSCPHWGEFRDDDCLTSFPSSINMRVFKARLWDIPPGSNAGDICTKTPALVRGVPFTRPTLCESTFFGEVWGSFYVADPSCPTSSKP